VPFEWVLFAVHVEDALLTMLCTRYGHLGKIAGVFSQRPHVVLAFTALRLNERQQGVKIHSVWNVVLAFFRQRRDGNSLAAKLANQGG
jgi:hypothetical protein